MNYYTQTIDEETIMEAVERVKKHIGMGIWCVLECLS